MTRAAVLQRAPSTDQGTPGTLFFDGKTLHTLELPDRDNKPQISRIPDGIYTMKWRRSPKFGMCYEITKVAGRGHILVHPANLAGDVALGFTAQLHGCVAPCRRFGRMRNAAGNMQFAGLVSAPAVREFNEWGATQDIILEVRS